MLDALISESPLGEAAERPLPPERILRPRSAVSLRYLAELWGSRELLLILALRDVRVRYKQAVFGVLWAVLQPVVQMAIFTVLFHRIAGIRADSRAPYWLFCCSGLVIWLMFANGLSQASESLVNNANLITKVYFPRAVIPIAAVLTAAADFVVAFALLLLVMILCGLPPGPQALLAVPIALLGLLCAVGLGLWTSAINLAYRDIRYALPFFIQLLVYLTPVFYPSSLVPARYRFFLYANPMAAVVDGFRAALLSEALPLQRLGVAALLIAAILLSGLYRFWGLERSFADRV